MPALPPSDRAAGDATVMQRDGSVRRPTEISASVVIPSLSGGSQLLRLVRTLTLSGGRLEVIVADNGLPADIPHELTDAGAQVVAMGANLGFGAAVNRAARVARHDVLVVLNDDIEPRAGFLDALLAPFSDDATMVAGVLLQEPAPHVIETAGIELDPTLSGSDYLHNEPASLLEEPLRPPFGPSGGAAAYLLAAFREVGGFDEGFFAYCEDVDLAIRLRAIGCRCALAPRAQALHAASGTLGYGSLAKAELVGFSRGHLMRKYGVLRDVRRGPAALASEATAVLLLARRHRSLRPGIARVRGWRSCATRASPPAPSDITVSLRDSWRRRVVRARMPTSTPVT